MLSLIIKKTIRLLSPKFHTSLGMVSVRQSQINEFRVY